MFEKHEQRIKHLENLIISFCYFSISVPFIAYALARIVINLIFQSINVLLLGINYLTYRLESDLTNQLKYNVKKNHTAYGFIFIKNKSFYALKALHATLIIAFLLPLHIMVQSFAFLAHKINLPTAKNLMSFVIDQTNDNDKEHPVKFFTEKNAKNDFWIFNQLANFDFWVSKNFYLIKKNFVIPLKIVNTSTDLIRKSLYNLNLITSVFKEIVPFITSIVGLIVILALGIVDLVQTKIINNILGIKSIQIFFSDLLEILARLVCLPIGIVIYPEEGKYAYDKSLLYASFIALEYFVIRAIDTITEIASVPFRFLSQALYTLYELFTDQDFYYLAL